MKTLLGLVVFVSYMVFAEQAASTTPQGQTPLSSTTIKSTTSADDVCKAASNKDCGTCLKHAQCLYCNDDKSCKKYPVGNILPMSSCKGGLDATRWGVCWVNFKILLIVMGVLGGVILLTLGCCIYCCCCRSGKNKRKYQEEEAKWNRQKEERMAKSEERRAERKEKHDEIRRKYGLIKEDNPYQRFDA